MAHSNQPGKYRRRANDDWENFIMRFFSPRRLTKLTIWFQSENTYYSIAQKQHVVRNFVRIAFAVGVLKLQICWFSCNSWVLICSFIRNHLRFPWKCLNKLAVVSIFGENRINIDRAIFKYFPRRRRRRCCCKQQLRMLYAVCVHAFYVLASSF